MMIIHREQILEIHQEPFGLWPGLPGAKRTVLMMASLSLEQRSQPAAALDPETAIKMLHILIVENESLLGAGVERLLKNEVQFNVTGIAPSNGAMLIETIRHLEPDVVIMDEANLLTIPIKLLVELLDYPELRVMIVNADDNRVQIYNKHQVLITQVADLVTIIRDS